jgi:hypothetical protein
MTFIDDPLVDEFSPTCGYHEAFVYERGGTVLVGQLTGVHLLSWERVRDDISHAEVRMVGSECCGILEDVEVVVHELHIYRSGEKVWEGPITRLEFEYDGVDIFAEDILWAGKKRALEYGYNLEKAPDNAVEVAAAIVIWQLVLPFGNPWNLDVQPVYGPSDPETTRATNSWASTVWEELDVLAEDGGIDYTMVGRTLYIWDVHLRWVTLAPLVDADISTLPRIVEYGNDFANRVIYTDGSGYAGVATADSGTLDTYSRYIDLIIPIEDRDEDEPPSALVLSNWYDVAARNVVKHYPPRQAIIVPANSTLMPSSPWVINDLIPGSWMMVQMDRMCRQVDEWQRLDSVKVVEDEDGERVQITVSSAPATMVWNP